MKNLIGIPTVYGTLGTSSAIFSLFYTVFSYSVCATLSAPAATLGDSVPIRCVVINTYVISFQYHNAVRASRVECGPHAV